MIIGSQAFFSQYSDFSPTDLDELEIIDTDAFTQVRQLTGQGRCLF